MTGPVMKKLYKLPLIPIVICFLTFSVLAISIGCKSQISEEASSEDIVETVDDGSVESLPKEAPDQQPAFENQTRVAAVSTVTPVQVEVVAENLSHPWGITFLPDTRMLISEKTGTIRIITLQGEVGDTILGVPPVYYRQDGGLMDITLDPDYENNRTVYWAFSEPYDTGYIASVARGILSEDESQFNDVKVIYRAPPAVAGPMHYGVRLLFDNENQMLVALGERFEHRHRIKAQELSSAFGKIIRIDGEGQPSPGNPFADDPNALAEVYATGFRDPQGLAFHPETGDLWSSDHGTRAGDEINRIVAGGNYGWPIVAYGLEYSREPIYEGLTQKEGTIQPVYYWDPAIAPGGINFYSGANISEWENNLFVAALRGKHLARLVIENDKVVGEERLLTDLEQRLRTVIEGPDGNLYVSTDEDEGMIVRIRKADL